MDDGGLRPNRGSAGDDKGGTSLPQRERTRAAASSIPQFLNTSSEG